MIGYKIKIYVEIKNVVSCYEKVLYITMQTLVIRLQQHNNNTTTT